MNGLHFIETPEEVQKFNTLPSVQAWKAELEKTHMWVQGFRQMFTSKPIRKASDLNGLRIRTPPVPIWQESICAIGATLVAIAYGDMYSGLQTKAIDGVELSFTAGAVGKFQ